MVRYRCEPEDIVRCKFCASTQVVKNGTPRGKTQNWLCRTCGRAFVDTHGVPFSKTSIAEVADAVDSYFKGMSLNQIRDNLDQQYHDRPSDAAVYKWVTRYSKLLVDEANRHPPHLGDTWQADEMVVRVAGGKGNKLWLWDCEDQQSRYLIASRLSSTRNARDAEALMLESTKRAGKIPKVIRTDRLSSYMDGIERAFGSDAPNHVQSQGFDSDTNTNLVERLQGTIRSRVKVMRGMKKMETARRFLEAYRVYYNCLRGHESLGGRTPAQAAGIKFPFANWKEVIESQAYPTRGQYASVVPDVIMERGGSKPAQFTSGRVPFFRVKPRRQISTSPSISRMR